MTGKPASFTLHVADGDLADLRERLGRTRYPDQAPGESRLWSASDWSLPREPDDAGGDDEPPEDGGGGGKSDICLLLRKPFQAKPAIPTRSSEISTPPPRARKRR